MTFGLLLRAAGSDKGLLSPALSRHRGDRTDVDASARLLLSTNKVLHPVDVVEAQGDGGYEALQRDLDCQTKVLL